MMKIQRKKEEKKERMNEKKKERIKKQSEAIASAGKLYMVLVFLSL